jgi:hypothetical protein
MSIPSRVLGSGVNQLSTISICGDGADSITATGSAGTDAFQLVAVFNNVSTTASGTGVKLPSTEMGEVIYVTNSGANTLKVYPYNTNSTINGTTSASVAANYTSIFYAVSNTKWFSMTGART